MPQFILNTPPTRADYARAVAYGYAKPQNPRRVHPYNDLSDFAKGYVEAMFFTNGDTGDTREDLLNDWGVERLTRASVANIARDCAAFYSANAAALSHARRLIPGGKAFKYARAPLDDQRLGNLFWYARQGHGVAFTDDGNARCLEALQDAAEKVGETYIEAYRGWIYYR